MADASRPPQSQPPGWGELFSALPQEAPLASRWPQIEARLDAGSAASARAGARSARRFWPVLAAGLCAFALLPFVWRISDQTRTDRTPTGAGSNDIAATADASAPGIDPARPDDLPQASAESPAAAAPADIGTTAAMSPRLPAARGRLANASLDASMAPTAEDSLESLYAASAKLETLLTLTRDTRVESGPAAALASGFDADLALIDARLAEPGLDPAEQRTLWRARVDTLKDASSFETHQRLLSAEGRRHEGALVSVD
jgi:hypothetical protein